MPANTATAAETAACARCGALVITPDYRPAWIYAGLCADCANAPVAVQGNPTPPPPPVAAGAAAKSPGLGATVISTFIARASATGINPARRRAAGNQPARNWGRAVLILGRTRSFM